MIKESSHENIGPILVADDHPATRRLLAMRLSKAGYGVLSSSNGRTALDILTRHFCPLVITDWMMPEMDGLALCRVIRQQSWEGYVYIIILTARDSQEDIVRGLEAGVDDYLTKPVYPAELLARLKTGRRILELEGTLKECNREISRLAITDPLTGAYNRHYLNDRLPLEIKRALRYGRPLGLILGDIDHFKKINDVYGHGAGDLVLQQVAAWLKDNIRAGVDWLARYGGEEFILVLSETDLSGCFSAAERLRHQVAENQVETSSGTIKITASFGISGIGSGGQEFPLDMETLLAEADHFLYQAKAAGGNRVAGHPFVAGLTHCL